MITTILDPDDRRLDPFRRIRDRDLRADGGRFVVESPRVVSRFLTAVREDRARVDAVLLAPEQRLVDPDEIAAVFSYQHTHIGAELMASLPKLKAVTLDRVLARLLK